MLPAAQIPAGVSTQDCLSWSPDGELAIAAGEQVYLLIPKRDGPEPWKHIYFRVGNFTFDEWPWPAQASFKDMSIGEEQARVTVTSLAFSPNGLAKYGRSVLAVLTSNLLLSLWAPTGDVADPESWERVLILNWTFTPPQISPANGGRRPLQRIRSMAWARACLQHVDRLTPFSTRKWAIHLLAFTDDDNGIYFSKVSSPFVDASMPWDAKTLLRKEVQPASKATSRPSLLSLALNATHFIDHVEFGAWTDSGTVPVIYHSSGTVHYTMLAVSLGPPLKATLTEEEIGASRGVSPIDQPSRTTSFQAQIDDQKGRHDTQNAFGGNVTTQSWGTASFDDLVATCISLRPTNSIEFLDPSDGSAVILFEHGKDTGHNHNPDKFPWQFSSKVDQSEAYKAILDCILDGQLLRSLDLSNFDFKIIYAAICAAVLADDAQRQQRLQAAESLMYLLQFKTETKLQAELEMVASCRNGQQISHEDLIELVRNTTEARGQQKRDYNLQEFPLLESCPYCLGASSQKIGFESMTEAHCPQNHPFSMFLTIILRGYWLMIFAARCALTFLPILEPGFSKRCADCGREYLNEQLHPGIATDYAASSQESTPSLAATLFDRFDTCPYCGGRFQD
jgi:hypothetical protein